MAAAPTLPSSQRTAYALDLAYDAQAHTLTGTVEINIVNTSEQAWNRLCLTDWASADAFTQAPSGGLSEIQNATITRDNQTTAAVASRDAENPCKWTVDLADALVPGEAMQLSFDLSIFVPENQAAFGYSDGVCRLGSFIPQLALWNGTDWVVHPHSDFSESAASACADFQLTLRAPKDLTVICTGESETQDGVTRAYAENVRDFAVVIGKGWRKLEQQYDGVLVRCYYKGSILMGKEALAAACDALGAFGSTIGRYPYTTLDVVSADIEAGGMEYPQLIMIKEDTFAWSTDLLHSYEHRFFRQTVAHEVAHQWFYGIVGNDQYAEPWLDEAFAKYLEDLYSDYAGVQNSIGYVEMAYPLDSSLEQLQTVYVVQSIVYWGGAAFLDEMQDAIGEDAFFAVLQTLYQEYGYKLLNTQAALDAFRQAANDEQTETVDALIDKYFWQS